MGCDIHLHTEVKIGGVWHCYGSPFIPRNYRLFAKMADVRNYDSEVVPISKPRGLPCDVSAVAKFSSDHYGADGHSHSYLTAPEIKELCEWYESVAKSLGEELSPFWFEDRFGYLFGNTFPGFTEYPGERPNGLEDVRFVFWFDN